MAFASYYPLNEKFVKEKGNKFGLESDTTLYNGPFVLADWKHEQGWKLKKNDHYWDKKTVKLEEINYSVVKEPTRVNFMHERLQFIPAESLISIETIKKSLGPIRKQVRFTYV